MAGVFDAKDSVVLPELAHRYKVLTEVSRDLVAGVSMLACSNRMNFANLHSLE